MGSIRKRTDTGFLYFDFQYMGKRCREYTRLKSSPANLHKMKQIMSTIEAEITLGVFDYGKYFPHSPNARIFSPDSCGLLTPTEGITLRDFAEIWFTELSVQWKRSYQEKTRDILDCYLLPEFGDQVITSITKSQILKFRANLAKQPGRHKRKISNGYINDILAPLRMILTEAADRYDFASPWKNIKPLKKQRSEVEPFSLDEVELIIRNVRTDFRNYYTIRFFTGMRTGEIDGLKWKYVDFDRRQIAIRETVVNGREETTKNEGSRRIIEMSDLVYDALVDQYKETGDLSQYVFCNAAGSAHCHRNITKRIWRPLLRRLKLKYRRPYQTRHTAATLWLAAGENPEWIARQMGHTTTEMLFTVYSRFVPNLTRKDGSAINSILNGYFSGEESEKEKC